MSSPRKRPGTSLIRVLLTGLLVVVHVATGIDYAAYRHDEIADGVTRDDARTTRHILENLNSMNRVKKRYTFQEATEHLLQYGALLRTQILDTFGSLVYDHYDDFSIVQMEALYRVYQETLERKYNIFDIVPSVLADPDTRPTKICSHIHERVHTCLKESSLLCMAIKKYDEPHPHTMTTPALNVTSHIYDTSRISEYYPKGFSLPAILRHLQKGSLKFTPGLFYGLLHNIQYDSFNDEVRTAERELVIYLNNHRLMHRNGDEALVPAVEFKKVHTISALLKHYLEEGRKNFPGKAKDHAGLLAEHVVREVDAISKNIEILGTVYENDTIHLKYLFNLILPSDVVDTDIIDARDYLLAKLNELDVVDKYLSIEKYQQSSPEQLLMEILGQLRDIHFAVNLATALHTHARFWQQSHMIDNLNELLELFDAYENLHGIPEHMDMMLLIDRIRYALWNSKDVTIEMSCTNPRPCLHLGLEIVLRCPFVNRETKRLVTSFFNYVTRDGSLISDICPFPMDTKDVTTEPNDVEPTTEPITEFTVSSESTTEPTTISTMSTTTTEEPTTIIYTTMTMPTVAGPHPHNQQSRTTERLTMEKTTTPETSSFEFTMEFSTEKTTENIITERSTTEESTPVTWEYTTTPDEGKSTEQTTTVQTTTEQTTTEQTTTEQTTTEQTTTEQTTTEQTTTEQSITEQTTTEQTTTEQSTTEQTTTEQTTTEQTTTEQTTTEQTTTEQTTTKQTTTEQATTEQTTTERTTTEQTTTEQTSTEQTSTEQTTTDQMITEQITTEQTTQQSTPMQTTAEEITTEQATTEKFTTEQITTEQTTTEQSTTEQTTTEGSTSCESEECSSESSYSPSNTRTTDIVTDSVSTVVPTTTVSVYVTTEESSTTTNKPALPTINGERTRIKLLVPGVYSTNSSEYNCVGEDSSCECVGPTCGRSTVECKDDDGDCSPECPNGVCNDSECVGDDCPSTGKPCFGDDCSGCDGDDCGSTVEPCVGDDCSSCDGDDCGSTAKPCVGDDCSSCDGDDCGSTAKPCVGDDCSSCDGDDCGSTAEPCVGDDCSSCDGDDCGSTTKPCVGDDCSGCDGDDCGSTTAPCVGDNCSSCDGDECSTPLTECVGDSCSDCSGDDCNDTIKPCVGDDCSSCEGDGCLTPLSECVGDDCSDCVGEDCGSTAKPCVGDDCSSCEGDECSTPLTECVGENCSVCNGDDCNDTTKPCVGDDCSDCDGNDCQTASPECVGDDCSTDCVGDNCSTTPRSTNSRFTDCYGDDCDGQTESTREIQFPTTTTTEKSVAKCDNKDPHHHRKLERLEKMRELNKIYLTTPSYVNPSMDPHHVEVTVPDHKIPPLFISNKKTVTIGGGIFLQPVTVPSVPSIQPPGMTLQQKPLPLFPNSQNFMLKKNLTTIQSNTREKIYSNSNNNIIKNTHPNTNVNANVNRNVNSRAPVLYGSSRRNPMVNPHRIFPMVYHNSKRTPTSIPNSISMRKTASQEQIGEYNPAIYQAQDERTDLRKNRSIIRVPHRNPKRLRGL